tara:strand:+ start:317 stop:967 length:651 start_codon:yes stop_codon:yes gene_type:complete
MNIAIILAGGSGTRFKSKIPKQYFKIGNKSIINYTIDSFEKSSLIDRIIIVVAEKYINQISKENPEHIVVSGGKSRFESSYNGILACPKNSKKVLIHDAARPFVTQKIITSCIETLDNYEAVVTSIQSTDTVIRSKNMEVFQVEDRSQIFLNQTPQGFDYKTILNAHKNRNESVTDDISLLDLNKIRCKIIKGSKKNIKITTNDDIKFAINILNQN